MTKNCNKCDECDWLFHSCTNPNSPNFLVVQKQCNVPCPCFKEKSEGLKKKNG